MPLHEWACVHAELQWIYDDVVPPAYLAGEGPGHRENRAWFVRAGKVEVVSGSGRIYRAGPGSWLMPPKEEKRHRFSPDARILSLSFFCHWPSGESIFPEKEGLLLPDRKLPALRRKAEELERLVRKELRETGTGYAQRFSDYELFLQFQALFLQWLGLWFRAMGEGGFQLSRTASGDDRLLRALGCLNRAPLEGGFPGAALRKESRLSDAHLNRLFYAAFGLSTRQHWERRRLDFAKACLMTSSMAVKEIAYRLGFKSDSHFVVWFKRLAGESPGRRRGAGRMKDEG